MKLDVKKSLGTISVPLAMAGAIIMAVITGSAAYFGTVNAQNEKVAVVKEELKSDISVDRQRLTAVETDMKAIKDSQIRIENKIDRLLKVSQ